MKLLRKFKADYDESKRKWTLDLIWFDTEVQMYGATREIFKGLFDMFGWLLTFSARDEE